MRFKTTGLVCLLVGAAALPAYSQYAAWWHFDENSGQTAADASGNGNTGTLGSTGGADADDPTWTNPSRFNAGLTFDGVNDFVQAADSATLGITGSITVEAWVNPTAVPVEFSPVVVKWNDIDGDFRSYFLALQTVGGQLRPRFDVSHTGLFGGVGCATVTANSFACPNSALVRSATGIPTGVWSHLVGVFDSVTGSLKLFVNGVLVNSVTAMANNVFDVAEPVLIGTCKSGSNVQDYLTGQIDEPRIWNIALTDAYVARLYALQTLTYSKTNTGPSSVPISATGATSLSYNILIQNNTGGSVDLTGFAIWDVLPAEFDLDGAPVTAGCTVTTHQPPGATHGGQPKLEPELLEIGIVSPFTTGSSCDIDVAVLTDQNPASAKGNKGPQWEPTSCPASGLIAFNEGIRVFDTTLLGEPFVVLGPLSPLTLTCTP